VRESAREKTAKMGIAKTAKMGVRGIKKMAKMGAMNGGSFLCLEKCSGASQRHRTWRYVEVSMASLTRLGWYDLARASYCCYCLHVPTICQEILMVSDLA